MNQAIPLDKHLRAKESADRLHIYTTGALPKDIRDDMKILVDFVKSLSSLPSDTQWIDINKKEPEGVVLAIGYQDEMLVGYCGNEYGDWTCEGDNIILEKVTHWMSLPLPPNN